MCDNVKGLQLTAGSYWVVAVSAGLLTVTAGAFGLLLIIKRITGRIDRAEIKIVEAMCKARLTNLADFVKEGGNVRWINEKR